MIPSPEQLRAYKQETEEWRKVAWHAGQSSETNYRAALAYTGDDPERETTGGK